MPTGTEGFAEVIRLRRVSQTMIRKRPVYEVEISHVAGGPVERHVTANPDRAIEPLIGVAETVALMDAARRDWQFRDGSWTNYPWYGG